MMSDKRTLWLLEAQTNDTSTQIKKKLEEETFVL